MTGESDGLHWPRSDGVPRPGSPRPAAGSHGVVLRRKQPHRDGRPRWTPNLPTDVDAPAAPLLLGVAVLCGRIEKARFNGRDADSLPRLCQDGFGLNLSAPRLCQRPKQG